MPGSRREDMGPGHQPGLLSSCQASIEHPLCESPAGTALGARQEGARPCVPCAGMGDTGRPLGEVEMLSHLGCRGSWAHVDREPELRSATRLGRSHLPRAWSSPTPPAGIHLLQRGRWAPPVSGLPSGFCGQQFLCSPQSLELIAATGLFGWKQHQYYLWGIPGPPEDRGPAHEPGQQALCLACRPCAWPTASHAASHVSLSPPGGCSPRAPSST